MPRAWYDNLSLRATCFHVCHCIERTASDIATLPHSSCHQVRHASERGMDLTSADAPAHDLRKHVVTVALED